MRPASTTARARCCSRRRTRRKRYGLTPRARVVATAAAGVAPRIMGFGPAPAMRKVLAQARPDASADMDVIELNEAFAAQALAVMRDLGLPDDAPHVNPNGGAIALGHPLGASGARLVTTAHRTSCSARGGRYALVHDVHRRGPGHRDDHRARLKRYGDRMTSNRSRRNLRRSARSSPAIARRIPARSPSTLSAVRVDA